MEYLVTVDTTCARNSTFVRWQDGSSMFGARFAKEEQAEQVSVFIQNKNLYTSFLDPIQIKRETSLKKYSLTTLYRGKCFTCIKLKDFLQEGCTFFWPKSQKILQTCPVLAWTADFVC